MKIVVFKGGLGNQLFQYAFYKYLSRKDETFYFYNDACITTARIQKAQAWFGVAICLQAAGPSHRVVRIIL